METRKFTIGALLLLATVLSPTPGWAGPSSFNGHLSAIAKQAAKSVAAPLPQPPKVVSRRTANEIELLLRVHTIIAEMQEQIGAEDAAGTLNETRLQDSLKLYAAKILDAYAPREKTPLWKKIKPLILAKMAWKTLAHHVLGAGYHIRDTARTRGVAVAAAVGLGFALDPIMLAVLPTVGLPGLVPISLLTPYPVILPGLMIYVQDRQERARIRALYDSPAHYDELQKMAEEARDALTLSNAHDVLIPLMADPQMQQLLTVSDTGMLGRVFQRLRINERTAHYESLAKILREKRPKDAFLEMMDRDTQTPKVVKAVMLARYMDIDRDPSLAREMRKRFAPLIQERRVNPRLADVEQWAINALHSKTFDDLAARAKEIPKGVNARTALRVWAQAILPAIEKTELGKDWRRLKAMRAAVIEIGVAIDQEKNPLWNEHWSEKLVASIHGSVPTGGPNWCVRHFGSFAELARRVKNQEIVF